MTGVKLAKAFGFLLMVVIVCSKQIPEEQHSTYPATDEAHFTTSAHENHDEDLKVNVGKRMLDREVYEVGTKVVDGVEWQVWFHMNPKANIARLANLKNKKKRGKKKDLAEFIDSLNVKKVFSGICDKKTLVTSRKKHFRLDMQKVVKCIQLENNPSCYNLQVQLNGKRKKGKSTTYANVLIPVLIGKDHVSKYLTDEVLREAFYKSSKLPTAAVTLEIKKLVQEKKKSRKGKRKPGKKNNQG
ncbi:Hypothetical predicted protein [Paramuricea clavata]|uniref:Uncharacterized protein n=1 Tax=Paramuricea clavata TaxID=317549 RepID=A0A6S7JS79_PARCT|nr:Hypothetical predicted protein [Paramuricea clavata]